MAILRRVAGRRAWTPERRLQSAPYVHPANRSEEHTSELQSRLHLVCRLLLEKKKNCHQVAVVLQSVQHEVARRRPLPANGPSQPSRRGRDAASALLRVEPQLYVSSVKG